MTDDADLALLTGSDVEDLLAAALATGGEELVSWRVRQVDHRPGASTTVSYDATVRGPDGESTPAPDGAAIVALLDRLPAAVCELPLRRSWTDEVGHYAAVTASVLPSEAGRCRDLAERVRAGIVDQGPVEPVHGDFYETQVLLDGGRISGLLDVDTAGPGRRADDLACLLAHVSVLAQMEPEHRESSNALGARWLTAFEQRVDPVELRVRTAGVVVSLATGPHRVQDPHWPEATRARLTLAEQWLDSADRADARPLGRG